MHTTLMGNDASFRVMTKDGEDFDIGMQTTQLQMHIKPFEPIVIVFECLMPHVTAQKVGELQDKLSGGIVSIKLKPSIVIKGKWFISPSYSFSPQNATVKLTGFLAGKTKKKKEKQEVIDPANNGSSETSVIHCGHLER